MFDLPDDWVWDFWVADDGTSYHQFRNHDRAGQFLGGVTDPRPVEWLPGGSDVNLVGIRDRVP